MSFDRIIGQEGAKKILINSLKRERTAHAYIFTGPDGVGKFLTARILAEALNCTEEDKPCGICRSCRKIQKGVHPDVKVIDVEGASIKINQMRELRRDMLVRPYEGRKKIYIIRQAEKMTPEASNSLLKTLEEPPEYGVIILVTVNHHMLLPTIRSRGQVIPFYPLSQKDMEEFLVKNLRKGKEEVRFLAAFSGGRPGEALKLADDEEFVQLRNLTFEIIAGLNKNNNEKSMFLLIDRLPNKKERIQEFLDIVTLWYRDLMIIKTGKKDTIIVNADLEEELNEQVKYLSIDRIFKILEIIQRLKKDIESNANLYLTLEVMFSKILGVYRDDVYSCRSQVQKGG